MNGECIWSEKGGEKCTGKELEVTLAPVLSRDSVETRSVPQSLMWAQKRNLKGAAFVSGMI